jgi:hypothetical protein
MELRCQATIPTSGNHFLTLSYPFTLSARSSPQPSLNLDGMR